MAAERKAVSSKLKLVISYNDENDNLCEKSVQMRNLVTGVEPANVVGWAARSEIPSQPVLV